MDTQAYAYQASRHFVWNINNNQIQYNFFYKAKTKHCFNSYNISKKVLNSLPEIEELLQQHRHHPSSKTLLNSHDNLSFISAN